MNKFKIYSLLIFTLLFGCERSTELESDDGLPPAVPTGLYVYYAEDGEVLLDWMDNSEKDLIGYRIYRRTESENFSDIAFTQRSFYLDDSLEYETKYFYKISAVDQLGRASNLTNEVSAVPSNKYPPIKPYGLTVGARNWENVSSIFLKWEKNPESDVYGYLIYRSEKSSFSADSTNLVGQSMKNNFNDIFDFTFYQQYYYKIKAIDKGGLISLESGESSDEIFEIPEVIFPDDNSELKYFEHFIIKSIKKPAAYKIVVQNNPLFGEFWSHQFYSYSIGDTLKIKFNPYFLEADKSYYWRIATFSKDYGEPNSISPIFKFTILSE